jgi:ABC-2 type transport system permease protein
MFYLLFGVLLNRGNANAAHYLFATYSVFGVMAPSLFGFGVGVAIERERGWLSLKRVAPMPPGAYLLAKMAMAALFALIIYIVLAAMAATLGGVRLAGGQWLLLGIIATTGVLPFCALGLMIGGRANASGAPALVNLIYLPMAFLSGLWMPLNLLPDFIGRVAPLWPAYHLAQLALATIGRGDGSDSLPHVAALLGFTAICFAIARRWLARAK